MVQLVKLPFSEIKVDKSFVITARESEESRAVIKSIVSLGMSLGLIITAEGIEDEDTQVFLRNIGCTLAQGYLFAHPLPGDDVMPWLMTRGAGLEHRRLRSLTTLSLLDSPSEQRFDALIRLANGLFDMPMSAFALVDTERLWFKSRTGSMPPAVLRASSFCNYTIERNCSSVINDTLAEKEFARNPLVVNAPHIRFYAGSPVHAADDSVIGTMILLDTRPRDFSDMELEALQKLAVMVEKELYVHPDERMDSTTRLFNHQATELRVPQVLELASLVGVPCTLHVFEVLNLEPGPNNEAGKKAHYVLTAFARILAECHGDIDFLGRFDTDKFVGLLIRPNDKQETLARWKLTSAVLAHNQSALPELAIQYRLGTAHTQPDGNYHFQSLLDRADLSRPAL
jgi:GGDEF domain-containing protein